MRDADGEVIERVAFSDDPHARMVRPEFAAEIQTLLPVRPVRCEFAAEREDVAWLTTKGKVYAAVGAA